jgi:hypothetical protein
MLLGTALMLADDLKFPVLAIAGERSFSLARTMQNLTTCTALGLKHGYYHGLLLVDSDGKAFKITDAVMLHGVGPFWGFNLLGGRLIRVELVPEPEPIGIPLQRVKDIVIQQLGDPASQEMFEEEYDDLDDLKQRLAKAKSIGEVIAMLDCR